MDLEDPEQMLLNASITTRIFETWSLSAAVRLVLSSDDAGDAGGFQVPPASDHARLVLTRYF